MFLRFRINQAEALRRGIDAPRSIVGIEVDPAKLTQADRNLIADRMEGINVCKLTLHRGRVVKNTDPNQVDLLMADDATLEALLDAVRADEAGLNRHGLPTTTTPNP